MENYEQKYKEAIIELKELFKSSEEQGKTLDIWFNDLANIFPELRKSDNESEKLTLTPFESELVSILEGAWQKFLKGNDTDFAKIVKEHSNNLVILANNQ